MNDRGNHGHDDGNVVVKIFPAVGTQGYYGAKQSIEALKKASPLYLRPRRQTPQPGPAGIPTRQELQQTAGRGGDKDSDLDWEPCIRVTFDSILKTRHGLRVGSAGDAEFQVPGISGYHFAVAFDNDSHLVIRDLGSTNGTTVIYDKKKLGPWQDFSWIVGGSEFLQKVDKVDVRVTNMGQFRLIIPRHDYRSESYRDRVEKFRTGTTSEIEILNFTRVGPLNVAPTVAQLAAPTAAQLDAPAVSPAPAPGVEVTIRKILGAGNFGEVYHVWDVRTGTEYARKEMKKVPGLDLATLVRLWKQEIGIMKKIRHKHIVSLKRSGLEPLPWLDLEYMPGGSIRDHLSSHGETAFTERECEQMLLQSLDALAYLHSHSPGCIMHRDIKPDNILILHRRKDELFIKLADFGLSNEGAERGSVLGTDRYLAPEVHEVRNFKKKRYTALVDIWSLGVVLVELLCKLPKQESSGVRWCRRIREWAGEKHGQNHLQGRRKDLLSFVLDWMLCLDTDDRKTAKKCHEEALQLWPDSNIAPESGSDRGEENRSHRAPPPETAASPSSTAASTAVPPPETAASPSSTAAETAAPPPEMAASPSETEAPPYANVGVQQMLEWLHDPQGSGFYESSVGGASNWGSGSNSISSGGNTVRNTTVEPREREDGPSGAPSREALLDEEASATRSAKRPRSTSTGPGSESPRGLSAGGSKRRRREE
ncbi:hypothetical protein RB593_007247 [Gaeumannomyces tritici]